MQMDLLGPLLWAGGVFKSFKLIKQVTGPSISLPRAGRGLCVMRPSEKGLPMVIAFLKQD